MGININKKSVAISSNGKDMAVAVSLNVHGFPDVLKHVDLVCGMRYGTNQTCAYQGPIRNVPRQNERHIEYKRLIELAAKKLKNI